MTFKIRGILSLMLAAVFILAACAPAPAPGPSATPDLNRIATDVAATIFAGQTATAAAQPSATPTFLPQPTDTPAIPTATPFVIVTSTSSGSSGGGGSTTKPAYACDVIRQRPFDNSTYRPGDDFDVKWTIINTGTATWPDGTDFKYFSGPKMVSQSFLELPQMKPGAQYSVHWDASAPDTKGFQVMTWIVQGGFCYPYVAIIVE